ncbi:sugar phosphate isomerase [Enterococcus sp. JM4C]|uniref:sugar phosphate isomerase/epimerase family protein n=1 Tax=Candidatus Enterococcus huntleyi TaxID=1857217 RepID=UPI00137B5600|nr:sugar phosphate isomerase/epimerase [Enterococcus sp. JM4C]KAF1299507.1 sugar phosphate isomerase [Enterococcus sp. JM4C]
MKPQIAIQLWSVQEACREDFLGTLQALKEAGYDGVEFAGYNGYSADEIAEMLKKTGLVAAGSHIPFEQMDTDLEAVLAFEKTIGNKRIVVPYATFPTAEAWQAFIKRLAEIAKAVTAQGFEFYYHNHAHEFKEVPNEDLLELMTKESSDIRLEVDLYWLNAAGKNVPEWVAAHSDSIGLFHMKDMKKDPEESTEIGSGVLPMGEYVQLAKELGLPWLIVEQEAFQKYSPMEAAKIDCDVLSRLVEECYK